jgi:hypothetical protein
MAHLLPESKMPNKAPEPTTMAVTIRAPSSTARASHGRGSSLTLAKDPLANAPRSARFHRMPSAIAKRTSVKSEAIKLVRGLPPSSTWDDLMYRIYVRQKIEAGLADIRAGRVHTHASIRKEFALP